MAKKKVTTTEEIIEDAPEEKKDLQPDYNEIHNNGFKELSESKPEEIKDQPAETKVEETPEKVEETKEPAIDIEENNRKIAEETAQKTREAIADLIKGDTKEETKTNKDDYKEWAENFTKQNGKEPSYTDAFEFLEDRAFKRLEAKQEEKIKTQEEESKKKQEAEEAQKKRVNDLIDEELNELYTSGKLTKIKNADDPNDQGVRERQALFKSMLEVNEARAKEDKEPIYSPIRIFTSHYKKPNRQPAGADAFMTGNQATTTSANSDDNYSYNEIHNKPWSFFTNPFKRS